MQLKKFLSKTRIVDITSTDFEGAVSELLAVVPDTILEKSDERVALQSIVERENAISTYLECGICMPHTRVKTLKQKYVFAVGRCSHPVKFRKNEESKNINMIFLLLADNKVDSYMDALSTLAKMFSSDDETRMKIKNAADLNAFRDAVMNAFDANQISPAKAKVLDAAGKIEKQAREKRSEAQKTNSILFRSALKIGKGAKCDAFMLFADTFQNFPDMSEYLGNEKVVIVSERSALPIPSTWPIVNIRAFSKSRFSQLRGSVMVGLTRGIFSPKDKVCCIGGSIGSNQVDTIVVLDIGKEFSDVFIAQRNLLPDGIKPEVFERIIDIATELSIEGREGKPVGCIFVIGNHETLKPHIKQLILNPFYGYKPEDRNVLNPFMDETVKEYSLIDGAFIVDGSGILESAGALIHTPDFKLQLPGGLGARHAAAYAISLMADCVSIVVSSSTGQITLFRRGQMLPISEKRKS